MTFTCKLPMPPSVNNLFATAWKTKVRFVAQEYKAWRTLAALYLLKTRSGTWPLTGRIRVDYTFHFKATDKNGKRTDTRPDVFNFEKALSDFLVERGVLRDDSDIDDGRVRRGAPATKAAFVEVRAEQIQDTVAVV